jgi:hypothetical protein
MEMPELNKLVEKYKNKDVVFLGFAINEKDKIMMMKDSLNQNYEIFTSNLTYEMIEFGINNNLPIGKHTN